MSPPRSRTVRSRRRSLQSPRPGPPPRHQCGSADVNCRIRSGEGQRCRPLDSRTRQRRRGTPRPRCLTQGLQMTVPIRGTEPLDGLQCDPFGVAVEAPREAEKWYDRPPSMSEPLPRVASSPGSCARSRSRPTVTLGGARQRALVPFRTSNTEMGHRRRGRTDRSRSALRPTCCPSTERAAPTRTGPGNRAEGIQPRRCTPGTPSVARTSSSIGSSLTTVSTRDAAGDTVTHELEVHGRR